jgi:hypothetical protein
MCEYDATRLSIPSMKSCWAKNVAARAGAKLTSFYLGQAGHRRCVLWRQEQFARHLTKAHASWPLVDKFGCAITAASAGSIRDLVKESVPVAWSLRIMSRTAAAAM